MNVIHFVGFLEIGDHEYHKLKSVENQKKSTVANHLVHYTENTHKVGVTAVGVYNVKRYRPTEELVSDKGGTFLQLLCLSHSVLVYPS